ncbi:hypothetical protein NMG60_11009626 [Bertholletia excelsa]
MANNSMRSLVLSIFIFALALSPVLECEGARELLQICHQPLNCVCCSTPPPGECCTCCPPPPPPPAESEGGAP